MRLTTDLWSPPEGARLLPGLGGGGGRGRPAAEANDPRDPHRSRLGRLRRRRGRGFLWRRRRGHARPYRAGLRDGARRPRRTAQRAAEIAAPRGAWPWPSDEGLDGPRAARLCAARAARPMGLWNRDLARQGHAVRPLGACRRAGRFRLGLFPGDDPRLPRMAHGSDDRRGRAYRHPRQPPRLGHDGD